MALPNKPSIKNVWASSGLKVEPSDNKVNTGWIVERPPHQFQNFLQNRSDQFLKHINEAGIPVWDAVTVYTAGKSYVQGSDGKLYKAITGGANSNPVGNPTNWMLTLGETDFQDVIEQTEDNALAASTSAAVAVAAKDTAVSTLAVFDDEPPASPLPGRHWTSNITGKSYEYIVDVDSGQWVEQGGPQSISSTAIADYLAAPTGADAIGTPDGTVQEALNDRVKKEDADSSNQIFYTPTGGKERPIKDKFLEAMKSLNDFAGVFPDGVTECGAAIQAALNTGEKLLVNGRYLTAQKLVVSKEGTCLIGPAAMWNEEVSSGAGFLAAPSLNNDFVLEFKNPLRSAMRSVRMENIGIDCGSSNAGGLAVYGAYDASSFERINITNVPLNKIGFLAAPGDVVNRTGVIQTVIFRSIWSIKRAGESTAPAIRTFGIQESEFVNCKASHSSSTVAAWEIQSCAGVVFTAPSFVNINGYGADLVENHGGNVGITIQTPTFENCKNTIRTYTTDAYMFGTISSIPVVGSVVRQPSNGSTASGIVWQASGTGVYVKNVTGAFAVGPLYDSAGVSIGTVSSLSPRGNESVRLINPRTLGGATVGSASGGSFTSLKNSEIELPDDSNSTYLHTYATDDTVVNCKFIAHRPAQMYNSGKYNGVTGVATVNLNYPENWPWPTQTVRLTNYPNATRVTVTKTNSTSFLSILPTTDTVSTFGTAEFRLYQGSVTFVRTGLTTWALENTSGSIFVIGVGRISELKRYINYTAASTATDTSTIDGAVATNNGATAAVNLNMSAIGTAVLVGTKFTLTRSANFPFRITPNASDIILGATAAGKYLELSAVGSSVTVECIGANTYAITSSSGTFTFQA